jgi:hypothetical protein
VFSLEFSATAVNIDYMLCSLTEGPAQIVIEIRQTGTVTRPPTQRQFVRSVKIRGIEAGGSHMVVVAR